MAGQELRDTVLATLDLENKTFSPKSTFGEKDSNSDPANLLASGKLYVLGRSGSDRNLEPPEDLVPVSEEGGLVMLDELEGGGGDWVV